MFNFNWDQVGATLGAVGTAAGQISSTAKIVSKTYNEMKQTSSKDNTGLMVAGAIALLLLNK